MIKEKQTIKKKWIYIIIWSPILISILLNIKSFTSNNILSSKIYVPLIIVLITFLFIRFTYFRYMISATEICYKFSPFHLKLRKISSKEVVNIEVLNYSPITEHGGWGIRKIENGWAYTISGKRGIKLSLADGRVVFFGTLLSIDSINKKLKEMNYVL